MVESAGNEETEVRIKVSETSRRTSSSSEEVASA